MRLVTLENGMEMSLDYVEALNESLFGDDKFIVHNDDGDKLFNKKMDSVTAVKDSKDFNKKINKIELKMFSSNIKAKYGQYRMLNDEILNAYKKIYDIMNDNKINGIMDTIVASFEYLTPIQKHRGQLYKYPIINFNIDFFNVSDIFKSSYQHIKNKNATYDEIRREINDEIESYLKNSYWFLDIEPTMYKTTPNGTLKQHINETKVLGDNAYLYLARNINTMSNNTYVINLMKKLYGEQVRLYTEDPKYLEIVKDAFDLMLDYMDKIINFNHTGSLLYSTVLKHYANQMEEIYNMI